MGIRRHFALGLVLAGLAVLGGGLEPARADIPGVIYNSANGHYYKWVAGTTTWLNGKAGAEALGGYLATPTSAPEQAFIFSSVLPAGNTACLGGTDETVENTWVWITGEPWSYTAWNGGEPNNVNNEDYLAMTTTGGGWNDVVGNTGGMSGYVVEWNENPNIPPPPAAPTALAGNLGPGDHVSLTWTDNSTNEASFALERKPSVGPFTNLTSVAAGVVAHEDATTFAGASYTYRVRAVNAGGVSAWSNEVTVDVPQGASAPLAPTDLHATATTPASMGLAWTDNSADETGFEVLKKNGAGAFVVVATTLADATSYAAAGLAPDTSYSWRVRALNGAGASAVAEATLSTDPTLEVATLKADLKDTPKPGKDSLKLQASFDFLPASDGTFDPVGEGITVRAGTDAGPLTIALPPGLPDWKVTATKATWKSAKGSLPKYKVEVLLEDRIVKVTVTGITLSIPGANPMRVSVGIGDDAGTQHLDWPLKKPGLFQFR